MYMKMIERMNAQINSVNVLSSSRARPETVVVYARRQIHFAARLRAVLRYDLQVHNPAPPKRAPKPAVHDRAGRFATGLVSRLMFTRLSSRTRPPL